MTDDKEPINYDDPFWPQILMLQGRARTPSGNPELEEMLFVEPTHTEKMLFGDVEQSSGNYSPTSRDYNKG